MKALKRFKKMTALVCCPLTGVTMAAGITRLVFMHQPGFLLAYGRE